jgi:hypothetical protein
LSDHRRARPVDARARLAALAALLGILSMPLAAHAERVGIVVAATVNTHKGEAERLANALGRALLEQLDIDVVAGSEAARRLPPGGVPDTCVVDSDCQLDVARRLGADQLLILAVVRVGARVQIDTTWVEVASGRTASRARILVQDRGRPARKVFADAVFELLPDAALRISAPRREAATSEVAEPAGAPITQTAVTSSRRVTTGVWVAGGLGAAALVVGSVSAISATRRHSELEERGCDLMPCPDADIDAVDTRTRLADAMFGVGLVAGVTAGILYWSSSPSDAAQVARLRPRPGLDVKATGQGFAITWGGRF